MPEKPTDTLALSQQRLFSLGYNRLTGFEMSRGTMRKDMGGVMRRCAFRKDGAPTLVLPNGLYDIEMQNESGDRLAIQACSRKDASNRLKKLRANPDFATHRGALLIWAWETSPRADGSYRLRIIDPRTLRDEIAIFMPPYPQGQLEVGT